MPGRPPKAAGGKMNENMKIWTCSCGKRLKLTTAQLESGKETCPHCGETVGQHEKDTPGLTVGDTQTINIGEMARMAQEGIDPSISGEWDTSKSRQAPSKTKPKKKSS